ncbi:S8 family serine peptidase [Peribacillus sp. NPDC097284]|uniref:S8 family serine peptidase n=1 Tax=Peribacillus sp. NPDC097284 TaxID=3364401 RepID=UPI00380D4195
MKKCIPMLFILLFFSTDWSHAYGSEMNSKPNDNQNQVSSSTTSYQTEQLIIKFDRETTYNVKESILQSIQAKELQTIQNGNFTLISLHEGMDRQEAITSLKKWDEVEAVEPNYKVRTSYIPTDSGYSKQWYAKKINMDTAWDLTKGSPDIKVAVIDAGIQATHPELKDHIINPFNAVTGSNKTLPSNDHGTHVAGIIGASLNGKGIAGIAPNVKIIPVNVFSENEADIFTIIDGIDYAVKSGADIINLSLTMEDYTEVLDYSIQSAWKKGILIVAAAGNEDTKTEQYPAALEHVLGVSATTKQDKKADFSNYGASIDLAAPGLDIYSTVPWNSYDVMSGTSMAAPVVSGVSALVLSKNPFLTPVEVADILQTSSKDLGVMGRDDFYGYGRVDAYNALTHTPGPLSKLTTSSQTLIEDGTNSLSLSFKAKKGTSISVFIHDANNKPIRKLVTNKKSNGQVFSTKWDGKLDNGSYAPSGKVKVTVKISSKKHSVSKSTYVTVKDEVTPELTFNQKSISYSPLGGDQLEIPFHLNKVAVLTSTLVDNTGLKIDTLSKSKTFKGGKNTLFWDGKTNSNKQAKDGVYSLQASLLDMDKHTGKKKILKVVVDTKAPKATMKNSSTVFKMTGASTITTTITKNESVASTISIINSKGDTIKKLESLRNHQKGNHIITWDGRISNNVYTKEGTYQFKGKLTDTAGNTRILTSTPFKVVDKRIGK